MTRRLLTIFSLWGLLTTTGCDAFDESLLANSNPGQLPAPPDPMTSDPSDGGSIAFAIRDVRLDQGMDWQRIGLNLDDIVTEEPDFNRECTPRTPDGVENPTIPQDGEGGIDNVFGQQLWNTIKAFIPTLPCEIALAHEAGHGTLVLRIDQWNGQPNDARVRAVIAPSVDATSADPATVEWDGFDLVNTGTTTDAPEPAWDPASPDHFFLNPRAFFNGDGNQPLVDDPNAYIVGGKLVMALPPDSDFELIMDRRGVPITLNEGALVAEFDATFDNVTSGFAAGRFPVSDLLQVGSNIGVCTTTVQDSLRTAYLEIADVMATQLSGDPVPTRECTAISIGVAFSASRANWSGLAPTAQPLPDFCADMAEIPPECDM